MYPPSDLVKSPSKNFSEEATPGECKDLRTRTDTTALFVQLKTGKDLNAQQCGSGQNKFQQPNDVF